MKKFFLFYYSFQKIVKTKAEKKKYQRSKQKILNCKKLETFFCCFTGFIKTLTSRRFLSFTLRKMNANILLSFYLIERRIQKKKRFRSILSSNVIIFRKINSNLITMTFERKKKKRDKFTFEREEQ